jgi:hypothetical protein
MRRSVSAAAAVALRSVARRSVLGGVGRRFVGRRFVVAALFGLSRPPQRWRGSSVTEHGLFPGPAGHGRASLLVVRRSEVGRTGPAFRRWFARRARQSRLAHRHARPRRTGVAPPAAASEVPSRCRAPTAEQCGRALLTGGVVCAILAERVGSSGASPDTALAYRRGHSGSYSSSPGGRPVWSRSCRAATWPARHCLAVDCLSSRSALCSTSGRVGYIFVIVSWLDAPRCHRGASLPCGPSGPLLPVARRARRGALSHVPSWSAVPDRCAACTVDGLVR